MVQPVADPSGCGAAAQRHSETVNPETSSPGRGPAAPERPETTSLHGDTRVDPWKWLREKTDPAVLAHLEAENAHTKDVLKGQQDLRETIFEEVRSRVKEDDTTVPYEKGGYSYYRRTEAGKQHPKMCRKKDDSETEEVLLDLEELSKGEYLSLGTYDVSPDTRLLAYSLDQEGDETYQLHFKDLTTGHVLETVEDTADAGGAWSSRSDAYVYTRSDTQHRPHQVLLHRLGQETDQVLYTEPDEKHYVHVEKSSDTSRILIASQSKTTSQWLETPAADPGTPKRTLGREEGVEYSLDHHHALGWILHTNKDAPGFEVATLHDLDGERKILVPHTEGTRIEGVETFKDHLAVQERAGGLTRIRILDAATGAAHVIEQREDVAAVEIGTNPEYSTRRLRYGYTSLTTPASVIEYDMDARTSTLLKQQESPGYDPDEYTSLRTWATAPDGTKVPVDVVHKNGALDGGPAPTLVYAYGSYEASIDPYYSPMRVSLLDRGVVFALAHPRGGGEMGREWYEGGKKEKKPNTFSDVIAVTEHLIEEGIAASGRICLRGGSAGGLMVGAVLNQRPDLYRAAVADVPFVDCLNTMLDPSLPLTITEYDEWGNPEEEGAYQSIRSYSPYENVRAAAYPAIFANTGLNDPRVGYWEPAKWVQALRKTTTGARPILLKVEMGAGHGGASGRYEQWEDEAENMAFILTELGADQTSR